MKNRILAVCDPEEEYVSRLMEYLNEKRVSPFYVRAFTSKEALMDFAKEEEVEMLLIASQLLKQGGDEEMRALRVGKRILLTQGQVPSELEGEASVGREDHSGGIVFLCRRSAAISAGSSFERKSAIVRCVFSGP